MIDIKNKRCVCGKSQPTFGNIGDKMPSCCVSCKSVNMVDIKSKICLTPLCGIRSTPKFKGFCSRCFFFTFPNEKISRNYKTKENLMVDFVKKTFPKFDWVCDKRVYDGCSLKRPDMYCDFGKYILIIECDENKHQGYSCDNKRTMTISKDFGHRPCIFLRFNPDSFIDKITNKKISSCFIVRKESGKMEIKDPKKWKKRLETLGDSIKLYSDNYETEKMVEIKELFFE